MDPPDTKLQNLVDIMAHIEILVSAKPTFIMRKKHNRPTRVYKVNSSKKHTFHNYYNLYNFTVQEQDSE